MRLGGPVFLSSKDPDQWVKALIECGYRAAYCPVDKEAPDELVTAYVRAAQRADIVIAEVGAWSNPISPNDAERVKAIAHCQNQLALAERVGAICCVNIAGSRGEKWDGPDAANLTAETFDVIVQSVRQIIDAVKPRRTCYSLETMPWVPPDSADSYLQLLRAIDRPAFGVHLDPVNMINSPRLAYGTGAFLRDCFAKLGPHIRSCHAKDITLSQNLTVHLDECLPGTGLLDYRTFITELDKLSPDIPLMLEHLPGPDEYRAAAKHIRSVMTELGVK